MTDTVRPVTVGIVPGLEKPEATRWRWGYVASVTLRERSIPRPLRHVTPCRVARHRDVRRAGGWSRSGTLLDEAATRGDWVITSAPAAASSPVIFAITAPPAR